MQKPRECPQWNKDAMGRVGIWYVQKILFTHNLTDGEPQLHVALQGEAGDGSDGSDSGEIEDEDDSGDENELVVLDPSHVSHYIIYYSTLSRS